MYICMQRVKCWESVGVSERGRDGGLILISLTKVSSSAPRVEPYLRCRRAGAGFACVHSQVLGSVCMEGSR